MPWPKQWRLYRTAALTALTDGAWGAAAFGAAWFIVAFEWSKESSLLILALSAAAIYGALLDLRYRVAPAPALGVRGVRFTGDLVRAGVSFAGAGSVIALFSTSAQASEHFFNSPLVGYRAEIALLGAFFVSLLVRLARFWRAALPGGLLVQLALFWVGPFYGFFSAPLFLALGLNGLGPMRDAPDRALMAAGMQVAEWCGWALALWLTGPARVGSDRAP